MTDAPGSPGARDGWVPPVLPWPALHSRPTCTLSAGVPAPVLIGTLGEELRRRRLRVTVARDGRSLRAKPLWPAVLNPISVLVAGEWFMTPRLDVSVAAETPAGTTVIVLVREGSGSGMKGRVMQALNVTAWRLMLQGVTLTATPWQRYTRSPKG